MNRLKQSYYTTQVNPVSLCILMVLSILSFCNLVEARNLDYTFFIEPDYIRVKLCVEGNNNGLTEFQRPVILSLDSDQDNRVEAEIEGIKDSVIMEIGDYFTLNHKPNARICITFKLRNFKYDSNLYFYHSKDNFLLLGEYALPILQNKEDEEHNVNFIWRNNSQCNYSRSVISNFGTFNIDLPFKVKINNKILANSFFVGGNFSATDFVEDGNPSKAIFLKGFPYNPGWIINYIKKIQKIHYNFFKPIAATDYYIFLSDTKLSSALAGLRNDISSFGYQVITLGPEINPLQIQSTIAHEHLHKWFGHILKQDINRQAYNSWFMEGITNYYTMYLNYKGGLWSLQDYLNSYNDCLYKYFSSEFNVATLEDINQNFTYLGHIAYLRGQILGHELDYKLRKISKNKITLDTYIKYLISLAENNNFLFSLENFKSTLWDLTGYDAAVLIQRSVIEPYISIEASEILDGRAVLVLKKMQAPKYGFDLFSSLLTNELKGIKKFSNAYKKGLRNGQKVIGFWLPSDRDKFLTLQVKSNNKIKIVKLLPEYQEVTVPQYRVHLHKEK